MGYEFFKLSEENSVGVIRLNRPPVNAFNLDMAKELDVLLDEITEKEDIKAVVFTGNGKMFSAGADISSMKDNEWNYFKELIEVGQRAYRKIEDMPKIAVAAIDGHCMGGALEFALSCDRRFMATGKAKTGLPEVKLGLMPAWGSTYRLPYLIGKSSALDLMIRGTLLSAEEAKAIGLVDEIFPQEEVLARAMDYAREVANGATFAIGKIKKCINSSFDLSFSEIMKLESDSQAEIFETHDFKEGTQAFLEKRSPTFTGKQK
ncbi:MAG TPA: enoyl-CoA hydratase/isomerase family protein [Thermodesulfobacteriota bacterium]|nr:enoyl-CoA hydratase/isomerase family protein [Thermodesulfobacteriota bacterium]